jgi:hypothetical protein
LSRKPLGGIGASTPVYLALCLKRGYDHLHDEFAATPAQKKRPQTQEPARISARQGVFPHNAAQRSPNKFPGKPEMRNRFSGGGGRRTQNAERRTQNAEIMIAI